MAFRLLMCLGAIWALGVPAWGQQPASPWTRLGRWLGYGYSHQGYQSCPSAAGGGGCNRCSAAVYGGMAYVPGACATPAVPAYGATPNAPFSYGLPAPHRPGQVPYGAGPVSPGGAAPSPVTPEFGNPPASVSQPLIAPTIQLAAPAGQHAAPVPGGQGHRIEGADGTRPGALKPPVPTLEEVLDPSPSDRRGGLHNRPTAPQRPTGIAPPTTSPSTAPPPRQGDAATPRGAKAAAGQQQSVLRPQAAPNQAIPAPAEEAQQKETSPTRPRPLSVSELAPAPDPAASNEDSLLKLKTGDPELDRLLGL